MKGRTDEEGKSGYKLRELVVQEEGEGETTTDHNTTRANVPRTKRYIGSKYK